VIAAAPSQFTARTIEEVVECLIDYRGKTPPKTGSGVRLITAKVIKGGQILDEPAEFIAADFYDEWMRRGLPQDLDVLITTEAPLGEVALLRLREPVALAQRVILLRANKNIVDPRFLFHALQGEFTQAELRARSSGTTVLGIKQSELRQVRVMLPALRVQRALRGSCQRTTTSSRTASAASACSTRWRGRSTASGSWTAASDGAPWASSRCVAYRRCSRRMGGRAIQQSRHHHDGPLTEREHLQRRF
jgi:hypothetical protein